LIGLCSVLHRDIRRGTSTFFKPRKKLKVLSQWIVRTLETLEQDSMRYTFLFEGSGEFFLLGDKEAVGDRVFKF
jgi:hypothetical protein